jgi:hypothetical protein
MKIKFFIESAGSFWQRDMLQKFHRGLNKYIKEFDGSQSSEFDIPEIETEISVGETYSPCDIAVIFGSWKGREKGHHITRNSVVLNAKCFVVIETPLLGRKVKGENQHWRIGVDGYLNHQGTFLDENDNKTKYDRLNQLNLSFPGWRENQSGHILLMLQLPGDASLRGVNIYEWAEYIINEIRSTSNKTIRIRPHPLVNTKPGDEFYEFFWGLYSNGVKGIEISDSKTISLEEDLKNAACSVAFSSGSSIDSILNGIPTIACDPGNFAYDISSNFPEDVAKPKKASSEEVKEWLGGLAYHQWAVDEMYNGKAWKHLMPIIEHKLNSSPVETGKKKKG